MADSQEPKPQTPCAECESKLNIWKIVGISAGGAFLIALIWAISK